MPLTKSWVRMGSSLSATSDGAESADSNISASEESSSASLSTQEVVSAPTVSSSQIENDADEANSGLRYFQELATKSAPTHFCKHVSPPLLSPFASFLLGPLTVVEQVSALKKHLPVLPSMNWKSRFQRLMGTVWSLCKRYLRGFTDLHSMRGMMLRFSTVYAGYLAFSHPPALALSAGMCATMPHLCIASYLTFNTFMWTSLIQKKEAPEPCNWLALLDSYKRCIFMETEASPVPANTSFNSSSATDIDTGLVFGAIAALSSQLSPL
ncbi:MAG: hypothetical protein MHM6MM_007095 [Cercozoa sp. M6MM]